MGKRRGRRKRRHNNSREELDMPASFEREIKKRGGAIRSRTKRLKNGNLLREAIVRKKGPRGGRVVAYVEEREKG